MDLTNKLKPCPFCGGEAELITYCGNSQVECKKCGASTKFIENDAFKPVANEVTNLWNQRICKEAS